MRSTRRASWAGLIVVLLVGCKGQPSEKEVSAIIGPQLIGEYVSQGVEPGVRCAITYDGLRKVDGRSMEAMGQQVYEMKYEATITFVNACARVDCGFQAGWMTTDAARANKRSNQLCRIKEQYDAGKRLVITGSITMVKSERGWQASGF